MAANAVQLGDMVGEEWDYDGNTNAPLPGDNPDRDISSSGPGDTTIFFKKNRKSIDHFLEKFEYKTWEGDFPQNEGGMNAIG